MPRPAIKKTPTRSTRRRRPYARRGSYGPTALLRASFRPEMKSYDYSDSGSRAMVLVANVVGAATMATGLTCFNIMTVGTSFYSRVGSKYTLMTIAAEADFALAQTDASAVVIRSMILYDRQANGAYPAIGDILANNTSAPAFNSAISIYGRDRFAVLRDTQLTLDPGSGLSRHWECYIKRPLAVSFKGATANNDITDANVGACYLLCFYVQQYGTTVPTISSVHTRCRYIDS